jgi:2-isopropylmalate synthase
MHYESLSPELVGRNRIFALDHMSGIASVRYALHLLGITAGDRDFETSILEEVKAVGKRGRTIDLEELAEIVEFHREHELR